MSTGSGFSGELYLRSTRPFLSAHVTQADARYLGTRLDALKLDGPALDVGCGHGRHLHLMQRSQRQRRAVVGVELDEASLRALTAIGVAPVVRGDFFRLPFRHGAFAAAYAWYNTLFSFEEASLVTALGELARIVRSRGQLIMHGTWWEWAAAQPPAEFRGTLPDGSKLLERAAYDPATGRDQIERELVTPGGQVMAGSFFIRYYPLDVLEALLDEAGFTTAWVHGDVEGHPVSPSSPDLIVGAVRR